MSESIVVALITGGLALLGTIITGNRSARELDHKLEVNQAVTNAKVDELTREVREHNDFARRVPVLENEQKRTDARLKDLESFHKKA